MASPIGAAARRYAAVAVIAAAALATAALATPGCDTLFPELSGKAPQDAAASDAGDGGDTSPRLVGAVCLLKDVRDWRSCAPGATGLLRITVEETRQMTMTDATGHFELPLSAKLDSATVAAVDPT